MNAIHKKIIHSQPAAYCEHGAYGISKKENRQSTTPLVAPGKSRPRRAAFKLSQLPKCISGFSLIEIMVVVVILGILAAIVVPRIINRPEQARIVKAKQDITAIQEALDLYKLDNGFYPTTSQGLAALVGKPSATGHPEPQNYRPAGYLKRIPVDPWGRPYNYLNPGIHNPDGVDIFTYGPTGRPGGTGENATIGNW